MHKRWTQILATALLLNLGLLAGPALALTTLKRREAEDYLGDIKEHLFKQPYTYELLKRSHRDTMHGRFSDGVIFNPGGGDFEYKVRKDGNHVIVIDSPRGREEEPVNEEAWRRHIKNTLSDDNRFPIVFLDDAKKELAIVYIGRSTQIRGKKTRGGLLRIEIKVSGSSGRSSRR